jgi:hypothetical protein
VIRAPIMMAEFDSGPALLEGIRSLRAHGPRRLDAFTPYEVPGLLETLAVPRSWLTWLCLAGGLAGAGGAWLLQWWINVVDYPLNIGGRPYYSSPAFIPITFEMGVLFASATALISALVLGGLPSLWHPVFDVEGFDRATIDRFWLAIDPDDTKLDRDRDTTALVTAGALRVIWMGAPS